MRYNAEQAWTDTPGNWDRWVDYGYTPDRLNRWYVNDNGNFAWMGANALNQYTSLGGAALGYDERFNLRLHGGFQYNYDAANRLVSAAGNGQSAGFVYDGLGRCVKRTVNGAVTVIAYDGWKPTVEWSELGSRDIGGLAERPSERERTSQWAGDGSYYAYNVYGAGPDEILWRYDSRPGYGHLRYHHDRHGNVTSLLNEHGSIIEKYSYDAFGAPKVTDPAGNDRKLGGRYASWYGNRFLFQGREFIHELGIYDYRHRMYHPQLGRFLQTDPVGLQTEGERLTAGQKALFSPGFQAPEAFSTSEINLYRYCGDDPVNQTDPSGMETLTRPEIDAQVADALVRVAQYIASEVVTAYSADPVGFIVTAATMGRARGIRIPSRFKLPAERIDAPPAKPGKAPTGDDGHPVEIHHDGGKPRGPFREMTRTDHRLGDNYKKNHPDKEPSEIDRKTFDQQRKEYWKEELKKERFGKSGSQ